MGKTKAERKNNNRIKQRKKDKIKLLEEVTENKLPHCLILPRGPVSPDVKRLSDEFQKIMEPNVPARLGSTRQNTMKDFLAVAAQLSLSHVVTFTQTAERMYVKFCRVPNGPTITFEILNYVRAQDILSTLKKQYTHAKQFMYSPCIMTNIQPNTGDLQLQVTSRMFLDMFPTIAPAKSSPEMIKRCCLLHYDEESDSFDLRHYSIRAVPVDIHKCTKKMLGRNVPDLGKYTDISEFVTKAGMLSDSEAEDDPNTRVTVPLKKSRSIALKSSVRLTELGPRMSLKIFKIEAGFMGGQVLYHSIIKKTDEEKVELVEKLRRKKKLKKERKEQQEKNLAEKKKQKKEHKDKCLSGMKDESQEESAENYAADDEDDDAQYFREEVGEEPDPDFFKKKRKAPKDDEERKENHPRKRKLAKDGDDEFDSKRSQFRDRKQKQKKLIGTDNLHILKHGETKFHQKKVNKAKIGVGRARARAQ